MEPTAETGPPVGSAKSPLSGVRVLDFSHILAGPFCTRLLADFGADVVKVESRTRLDLMGALRPDGLTRGRLDRPPAYLNTNRGKRSITINLKIVSGRELAARLAARADVIVENFSSDVMARLELDYDRLRVSNPGLIYLSLSGYGHTGPRKHWTSMNMNLQAHTGLMMVTGEEGDPPIAISNSWNDYVAGLHGCFVILQALSERARTGRGAVLDVSQFECSVATLGALLIAGSVNHRPPARPGNRCSAAGPQEVYRCAGEDEWCAIVIETEEQWRTLVRLVGDHRLDTDRFATALDRLSHRTEIDTVIEEWTRGLESREVERVLRSAGLPAVRMHRIADVMASAEAHSVFPELHDPREGKRRVTGLPLSWDGLKLALRPAPALGEHTPEVLRDWLDIDAVDIEQFTRQGALE